MKKRKNLEKINNKQLAEKFIKLNQEINEIYDEIKESMFNGGNKPLFSAFLVYNKLSDDLNDIIKEIDKRANHSKKGRKPKNWKPVSCETWASTVLEKL